MNKYIQLTLFQSFLFHFQMLLDSSHIFLLMISIVCVGYSAHVCVSTCIYMHACMQRPVKNNGYLFSSVFVNFIVLRQTSHWTWGLSRRLIGLDSSQDLSILAPLQPHALGLKVRMARPSFYVGTGEFKVRWRTQKALSPTKPPPSPHHWYLAQYMSWGHTLNDF